MNMTMKKLLEELNFMASKNPPAQTSTGRRIFSKIRWWGLGLSGVFLMLMAFVGLAFAPFSLQKTSVLVLAFISMAMSLFVVISEILEDLIRLLRWKTVSFFLFLADIDFDNQCAQALMKFKNVELERAKLWIKAKIEKETGRLSLFGTEKISLFAIAGFLSAGWTVYEKVQAIPVLPPYQIAIQLTMGFVGGTILGSAMLRISQQRFQKMLLWIDIALFEKAAEESCVVITAPTPSIEKSMALEAESVSVSTATHV